MRPSAFRSTIDSWTDYRDGRVIRRRSDANNDGAVDSWTYYRNGEVSRHERDTTGDGFRDRVGYYRDGQLAWEEHEIVRFKNPDRALLVIRGPDRALQVCARSMGDYVKLLATDVREKVFAPFEVFLTQQTECSASSEEPAQSVAESTRQKRAGKRDESAGLMHRIDQAG